jgi:hypothetical protein
VLDQKIRRGQIFRFEKIPFSRKKSDVPDKTALSCRTDNTPNMRIYAKLFNFLVDNPALCRHPETVPDYHLGVTHEANSADEQWPSQ